LNERLELVSKDHITDSSTLQKKLDKTTDQLTRLQDELELTKREKD
jgi:hypothetical protein